MKNSTLIMLFRAVMVGVGMSFVEMWSHKMRSVLSILGVLLGVASLVAMLTLIGGIDKFLNERMDKWIGSIWIWQKWSGSDKEARDWSRSPGLKLSDGTYLKENSKYVKEVPRSIQRDFPILLSNQSIQCRIRGIDSASLENDKEEINLIAGTWFSERDYKSGNLKCIVSLFLAEKIVTTYRLESLKDVIDRSISLGKYRFTIIGIVEPENKHSPPRQLQKRILVPLLTMQKYGTGFNPDPGSIEVQVTEAKHVKLLSKFVASTLASHHRGAEDFEYRTAEWIEKVTSMLNNVSMLMAIISILSLTIGGLSIMNVMLSSISERIREIGIRKALGVNNIQIFIQFVAETTTLSLTGGVAGFVVGLAPLLFKDAILQSTQGSIEPTILPLHVLFTFALVTILGILFGLYPAIKASRMDPVDALRYE